MKNRTRSIIEIKGKRYDSATGLPVLNDVFAPSDTATLEPTHPVVKSDEPANEPSIVSSPTRSHQPHSVASHANRHRRQPSHTLNRKSVKRPDIRQKPAIKTSRGVNAAVTHKPSHSLVKQSAHTVNPVKAKHASKSPRSASVSHFVTPKSSQNIVKEAEKPKPSNSIHRQPAVASRGRVFDITPRRAVAQTSTPVASIATPASPENHFGAMLNETEKTNHHRYLEYTPVKKRTGLSRLSKGSRRALAFGITGLAVLVLAGYAVFLNKAHIELQLADAKAGINATLPGYQPSGYSIGKFNYRPGLVAINYTSEDGHNYRLSQQSSRLDSKALAQKLAAEKKKDYQTLHASGQTIFASTDSTSASAAWVNGGILYQLDAQASLSQDQIAKIATSM